MKSLLWSDVKQLISSDENVSKFVFTKDDAVVEAVLYKYPTYEERTVICCSVMSGCPMGCRFCGTGEYFVRNLKAEEIVDQVTTLLNATNVDPLKIQRLQIMTMSMGEPLLNRNLQQALETLYQLYPNAALLISSSGPDVDYEWFIQLSERIPTIGLQFSVHESTDEARDALIPFKKKLNMQQISEQGKEWSMRTGRRPFFNYCVHEKNDTQQDVQNLLAIFDPVIWNATISVICERDETISGANARQRSLATNFMSKMVEAGYNTRCFDPAGQDDIGGGCGMLWQVQKWIGENPDKAIKSVGYGLEKVHSPKLTCGNG